MRRFLDDFVFPLLLTCCVVLFLVSLYALFVPAPHDSTDPAGGRSGLRLLTDAGTGCQYVHAGSGGLTPRLDATGKQVCGVAK